jgi:hypothetical protein
MHKIDVLKSSWVYFIKHNMLEDLLKLYDNQVIFKGTLNNKATDNRNDISKYFKNLMKITTDVKFLKSNRVSKTNKNLVFEIGKYNFYTFEGKIEAQYQFIFDISDKEAKIVSHFSTLLK